MESGVAPLQEPEFRCGCRCAIEKVDLDDFEDPEGVRGEPVQCTCTLCGPAGRCQRMFKDKLCASIAHWLKRGRPPLPEEGVLCEECCDHHRVRCIQESLAKRRRSRKHAPCSEHGLHLQDCTVGLRPASCHSSKQKSSVLPWCVALLWCTCVLHLCVSLQCR